MASHVIIFHAKPTARFFCNSLLFLSARPGRNTSRKTVARERGSPGRGYDRRYAILDWTSGRERAPAVAKWPILEPRHRVEGADRRWRPGRPMAVDSQEPESGWLCGRH